jgi:hypothetical protein
LIPSGSPPSGGHAPHRGTVSEAHPVRLRTPGTGRARILEWRWAIARSARLLARRRLGIVSSNTRPMTAPPSSLGIPRRPGGHCVKAVERAPPVGPVAGLDQGAGQPRDDPRPRMRAECAAIRSGAEAPPSFVMMGTGVRIPLAAPAMSSTYEEASEAKTCWGNLQVTSGLEDEKCRAGGSSSAPRKKVERPEQDGSTDHSRARSIARRSPIRSLALRRQRSCVRITPGAP